MTIRFTLAAAIASAFLAGTTAAAFAHAHLKAAVPADGSTVVQSPAALELDFSEGLNLAFSGVALKSEKGEKVAVGKAHLKPSDDKTLLVPLSGPLAAGRYTVSWHALSRDGHKTKGSYSFTVAPK